MVSPKQQRVLTFITGYIASNKRSPTMAEIGRHFQMSSPASVHKILSALEREGLITRTPNIARGIQVVEQA